MWLMASFTDIRIPTQKPTLWDSNIARKWFYYCLFPSRNYKHFEEEQKRLKWFIKKMKKNLFFSPKQNELTTIINNCMTNSEFERRISLFIYIGPENLRVLTSVVKSPYSQNYAIKTKTVVPINLHRKVLIKQGWYFYNNWFMQLVVSLLFF